MFPSYGSGSSFHHSVLETCGWNIWILNLILFFTSLSWYHWHNTILIIDKTVLIKVLFVCLFAILMLYQSSETVRGSFKTVKTMGEKWIKEKCNKDWRQGKLETLYHVCFNTFAVWYPNSSSMTPLCHTVLTLAVGS